MNPKYKNHLPKFSDPSPLLSSLFKLDLLKKVLEVVDSPTPKCEFKKRGEFLFRETVAMAPHKRFVYRKKKKHDGPPNFFWKNLPYFYLAFLGMKTERDLKKSYVLL